ncbi:hypothetical protein OG21DRAFT_1485545 [Imleria badia]|nr:hypothetical protein OG21DRAFT_1485545 [Imleria badia]
MQDLEPRHIDVNGSPVTSLVYLVDGKHIVGGCKDGSIRRWRVNDGREIGPVMKSDGTVNSVAASPDGKWIASGGVDRKVTIWNADSHQKAGELTEQHQSGVTALDISPDSSWIAAGSEDGLVFVWRMESRELVVGPLRHQESQVSSVRFSPTGDRLASACTGWDCHSIRIWDRRTGDQLVCLSADTKPTYSLSWTRDGRRLFAGGPRGSIRCFDIRSQSIISGFGDLSDSVTSLSISNNDRFLVASSASGSSFGLWDVNTFQPIRPTVFQPSEVLTVAISPDDEHFVIGSIDKKISIRSLSDMVPLTYFFHRLTPSLRDSEPFTYMSKKVHEAWRHGNFGKAEVILSKEITKPDCPEFVTYSLANRALVRARLRKWNEALEDAQMSNNAHGPLMAVARCFALHGQGNHQEAMETFDFALGICDANARPFIEPFKFLILFEVGLHSQLEDILSEPDPTQCTQDVRSFRSVVKAQMLVLLAEDCMVKKDYAKAIQLLTKAQDLGPLIQVPELSTISLIFGRDFDGLQRKIQQQKCKALFASDRTHEAIDSLLGMQRDLEGDPEKGEELFAWLGAFKLQCLEASENLGDGAMRNENHDDAIVWYSATLNLNPTSPEDIFMKRSEAYAETGLWENALMDVTEVIQRDNDSVSLHQAYKMKFQALRNLKRHDEAIKTLNELPDELRDHHTRAKAVVDDIVKDTLRNAPLRMIDTETGRLYEAASLKGVFEGDPVFGDFIVSMTECMDDACIKQLIKPVVEDFFRYVMFSHRWQGKEPLYTDVGDQSVYDLPTDEIPRAAKLQTFCRTASKAGYRWAWSDTCCIDQKNQREFAEAINSMFRWYHHSSLTLVYLWDVSPSSPSGGLTGSEWITRGWTLQEFLAPRVIRFFNGDWSPYLDDQRPNHKESDVIIQQIADAVGVSATDLLSFRPSTDDVRWKLHMASKRNTTVPQDAAYCLFGIFNVVMSVIPGEEPHQAIGRLLQEVMTCSKSWDVGCLAWVGQSSELNSCLPTQVQAYQGSCRTPLSIGEEMQRSVLELESSGSFTKEDQALALALYDKLASQRRAEFTGWHLRLPCIAFRVTALDMDRTFQSNKKQHIARADALEVTRITTAHKFSRKAKDLLLVCPWIHELLDLDPPQDAAAGFDFTLGHLSETRHENLGESNRQCTPDNDRGQPDHLNVHYEHSGPSTPSSVLPPSPSAPFDERTRALRFVARLRQPMTALLLSPKQHGVYKRVATDHEIVIQLRKEVSLASIVNIVQVVEII